MDEIEEIKKMKLAMKFYKKKSMYHNVTNPQLHINSTSLNIAYILCLNYLDISYFQKKYLFMWSSNQTHSYIKANDFISKLGLNSSPVFDKFFKVYGLKVDFNTFLIFIYVFGFCTFENLVKLLLSICGTNPNYEISLNQLIQFLSYYRDEETILSFNEDVIRGSGGVYIDNVCMLLKDNSYFKSFLCNIKKALIKDVITSELYLEITNRIRIFKDLDLQILGSKLVETKCEHLSRVLFTHKSCPYESDYRNLLHELNPDSYKFISNYSVLYDVAISYPTDNEEKEKHHKVNKGRCDSFISLDKESVDQNNITSNTSNSS